MIGGINPWATMWTSPRSTIRTVVNVNPRYGVFYLAWIYALQSFLYFASYWSFGLSYSFFTILIAGIVLSPLIGMIWVYFMAWIFFLTGKWIRGTAPLSHLRAAVAWSILPSSLTLLMWLILMIAGTDMVFVHGVSGPSSLFIHFISLVIWIWSVVLLIISVREVQGFSAPRAVLNVFLTWVVSWVAWILFFMLGRYIYLNI